MEAVLSADVNHSGLSMLLAVYRCLAALGVKVWMPRAGGI